MKWSTVVAWVGVFLTPVPLLAQEPCEGGVCVQPADLQQFVQLAQEAKCRETTLPTYTLDPVTVVVDEEGRYYGSGSQPQPYKLTMQWCNYTATAEGQVTIQVAKRVPKEYGFRFRPKAALGYLPVTAFEEQDAAKGLDIGLLLEPLFYRWVNLNGYVGVRSTGVGVGVDVTKNFDLYLGWAITWGTWQHNPHAAISFAFW
jgi:hypothetical protein